MPIYEYSCDKCQAVFEKIVSRADADKKQACSLCGTPSERVPISLNNFQLKGKWFKTKGEY